MTEPETDAIVVGSGPNGLAAAVALAKGGLSVTVYEGADHIGGGTRSAELTLPGVLHDVCSSAHPFAVASPFLASLPLAAHGLEWCYPEVDLAHPLDGGRAGTLQRSLDDTVAGLGSDGATWRKTFGPLVKGFDQLVEEVLGPILHLPHHPVRLASFGTRALLPATVFARRFRTDEARALFGGSAAHAFRPLNEVSTAALGVMLTTVGHRRGWPVAKGGSQNIGRALASLLVEMGGTIHTGVTVNSLAELPPARIIMCNTTPQGLLRIAGDRVPGRTRRDFSRWRFGPGAFKLDLAVEEGIPWSAEVCRRAGTIHVGGTLEEIAVGERAINQGTMPESPFLLVGQQYLCDPQRSAGNVHPIWIYAHVPHGYTGDVTESIVAQIERFAPGFRDRIVGRHVATPADLEANNPNYVGGDIAAGANNLGQLINRPRFSFNPYDTGIPGVYLCSASTPPGAGTHGMGGYHAAQRALRLLAKGQ